MHVEVPVHLIVAAVGLFGSMAGYIVHSLQEGAKSMKNEQRLNEHERRFERVERDQAEITAWLKDVDEKVDQTLNRVTSISADVRNLSGNFEKFINSGK